jgi:hypothetical protein
VSFTVKQWFRMPVLLRTCFTPPRAVQCSAETIRPCPRGTRSGEPNPHAGYFSSSPSPLSSFRFASSRYSRIHFPPRKWPQPLEASSRTHPRLAPAAPPIDAVGERAHRRASHHVSHPPTTVLSSGVQNRSAGWPRASRIRPALSTPPPPHLTGRGRV